MRFRVSFREVPSDWPGFGELKLVHQSKVRPQEFQSSTDFSWDIEVNDKGGLWTGANVGRNSDGRRFVYFAWLDRFGRIVRRIKLYQDQVSGVEVTLESKMPDGTPACSTARIIR